MGILKNRGIRLQSVGGRGEYDLTGQARIQGDIHRVLVLIDDGLRSGIDDQHAHEDIMSVGIPTVLYYADGLYVSANRHDRRCDSDRAGNCCDGIYREVYRLDSDRLSVEDKFRCCRVYARQTGAGVPRGAR